MQATNLFTKYVSILAVMLICTLSFTATGQTFLSTNGKAVVNEAGDTIILRGMGLGGWMLQEGYMLKTAAFANPQHEIRERIVDLMGETNTDEFYEAWLANHCTREDIDSLASWGFNSVRLPMHYNLFTLPIEDEPVSGEQTWLDKGFVLTDSLINWCRANNMYVVLDMHACPGGQGEDAAISDYDRDKPSLWQSQANRDKLVALWKKLAERYKDEPVVGAYDLINETNWNMDNNQPLKDIYLDITNAIRSVDNNHIIIIEGNWWANDFTNLTPPWDDNMMYGPHKYWSINDKASIQWVIDIRDQHDVPIYFGECGENSNVWFRDAIKLFEDEGMGWAWWPMKKIDDIAGPLSINRSNNYQILLDYWEFGGQKPSEAFAKATLMQLTEDLKIENCDYKPDVIDAMFRQVQSDEAIPYRVQAVPGVVYASDYDMGIPGSAYFDIDIANYQVSTGNYTAWNRGWTYRNDGVDLEVTNDNVNSNGYNIGFVGQNEWMQYSIDVDESALYNVEVRVATQVDGGQFHLAAGTADITPVTTVPNTGGWQTWQSVTIPNVLLTPEDDKLRFYVDQVEFNLGSFKFTKVQSSTNVQTDFYAGATPDESTIHVYINKPLDQSIAASLNNFTLTADGNNVSITSATIDPNNPRIIILSTNYEFSSREEIRVSYSSGQLVATDGVMVQNFSNKIIRNTIAKVFDIPGRVEMEDYFFQQGIQLENTNDDGGGKNIGFLDQGDYLDYYIEVAQEGTYQIEFRTAAQSEQGAVRLQLIDAQGNASDLVTKSFPSTGGWQSWTTTTAEVFLPAGRHQLRVNITASLFNMNWMQFNSTTPIDEPLAITEFKIYPNPAQSRIVLQGTMEKSQHLNLALYNVLGEQLMNRKLINSNFINESIDLSDIPNGSYFVRLRSEDGSTRIEKVVKMDR